MGHINTFKFDIWDKWMIKNENTYITLQLVHSAWEAVHVCRSLWEIKQCYLNTDDEHMCIQNVMQNISSLPSNHIFLHRILLGSLSRNLFCCLNSYFTTATFTCLFLHSVFSPPFLNPRYSLFFLERNKYWINLAEHDEMMLRVSKSFS